MLTKLTGLINEVADAISNLFGNQAKGDADVVGATAEADSIDTTTAESGSSVDVLKSVSADRSMAESNADESGAIDSASSVSTNEDDAETNGEETVVTTSQETVGEQNLSQESTGQLSFVVESKADEVSEGDASKSGTTSTVVQATEKKTGDSDETSRTSKFSYDDYVRANQLNFFGYTTENTVGLHLDPTNRWVLLKERIPWDELIPKCEAAREAAKNRTAADRTRELESYLKEQQPEVDKILGQLSLPLIDEAFDAYKVQEAPTVKNSVCGRKPIPAQRALAAVIVRGILDISYRNFEKTVSESPYIQYFMGYTTFEPQNTLDYSAVCKIEKILDKDVMQDLNEIIIKEKAAAQEQEEKTEKKTRRTSKKDETVGSETSNGDSETPAEGKAQENPDTPIEIAPNASETPDEGEASNRSATSGEEKSQSDSEILGEAKAQASPDVTGETATQSSPVDSEDPEDPRTSKQSSSVDMNKFVEFPPQETRKAKAQESNDEEVACQYTDNAGTYTIDSTCGPVNVAYPMDFILLNNARKDLEDIINRLCKDYGHTKPGTNPIVIQRLAQNLSKNKKKTEEKIRPVIKVELGAIKKNLEIIEGFLGQGDELTRWEAERCKVVKTVYAQQKYMYDNWSTRVDNRIVSIDMPFIRPISRGKAKASTEFGPKFDYSIDEDGNVRLERFSYNAYNEACYLIEAVEAYKERHGHYPKKVLADQIYRNRANRRYCKEHGIQLSGPRLGRKPADEERLQKELEAERGDMVARIEIERRFSRGKRIFGLDRIMERSSTNVGHHVGLAALLDNLVPTGF